MLYAARIVAVDDNPEHLEDLESRIKEIGSSCFSIKYESVGGITYVMNKGIRLVFMDINLIPAGSPGENTRNFSVIQSLLERIIPEDNGPYALVTWTTTDCHNELVAYLNERMESRKPFATSCLEKNIYLTDNARLRTALSELGERIPQIGALLNWEQKTENASIETVNTIVSLVQNGGATPAEFPEKLDELLSILAIETAGKKNVRDRLFSAVNKALVAVLYDRLLHMQVDAGTQQLWSRAVTKYALNDIGTNAATAANLNTIFHLSKSSGTAFDRGAILELPSDWLVDAKFLARFGENQANIMMGAYGLKRATANLKWYLTQVQAPCDQANPKVGPIPYVLSLKVPAEVERKDKKLLPDALYFSPSFKEDETVYALAINFRFSVMLSKETVSQENFAVFGRIREQLLNEIISKMHSYLSRPGIISFRPKPIESPTAVAPQPPSPAGTPHSQEA